MRPCQATEGHVDPRSPGPRRGRPGAFVWPQPGRDALVSGCPTGFPGGASPVGSVMSPLYQSAFSGGTGAVQGWSLQIVPSIHPAGCQN